MAYILNCMTAQLANQGEDWGTLGLPEPRLRNRCAEAEFQQVRRVPMDIPFNALYEIVLLGS